MTAVLTRHTAHLQNKNSSTPPKFVTIPQNSAANPNFHQTPCSAGLRRGPPPRRRPSWKLARAFSAMLLSNANPKTSAISQRLGYEVPRALSDPFFWIFSEPPANPWIFESAPATEQFARNIHTRARAHTQTHAHLYYGPFIIVRAPPRHQSPGAPGPGWQILGNQRGPPH